MRACCPICVDIFDSVLPCVTCPCGHVFHESCLFKWLDTSSTCPECRKNVTFKTTKKLFFNILPSESPNVASLENEVDKLKASVAAKDIEINKIKKEKSDLLTHAKAVEKQLDDSRANILQLTRELTIKDLNLKSVMKYKNEVENLKKLNAELYSKLNHFQNIQIVINGTQKDVDDMLQNMMDNPTSESIKQTVRYCSLLKREVFNLSESKQKQNSEINHLRRDISVLNVNNKKLNEKIAQLEEQIHSLDKENERLLKRKRSECLCDNTKLVDKVPEDLEAGSSNIDSISVTPVRDRVIIHPFTVNKVQVIPYEKTMAVAKSTSSVGQSAVLRSIKHFTHNSPEDTDSVIRTGYNGLGGHSNFISKSFTKSFKPPHKRK